jgi:hypothetical protein
MFYSLVLDFTLIGIYQNWNIPTVWVVSFFNWKLFDICNCDSFAVSYLAVLEKAVCIRRHI